MKTESERKVEHSPLPWKIGHNYPPHPCHIHANPELTTRGPAVARTDLSHGLGDARLQDEANAAFIVKACNAHDALVEALEMLHDFQNGPPLLRYEKQWNEAMAKTEAALKLAGK